MTIKNKGVLFVGSYLIICLLFVLGASGGGVWGCGAATRGSTGTDTGDGSSGAGTGETEAGTSNVTSLQTIPSADIGSLDPSLKSASSSSALKMKSAMATISESEGFSRHGCEADMHKKEAMRITGEAEISKCYIKAMEKLDLIEIGDEVYTYYLVKPEAEFEDEGAPPSLKAEAQAGGQGGDICDNISKDDKKRKEACDGGEMDTGAPEEIKARCGVFSGELRCDLCFNGALEEEMQYQGNGALYAGGVRHQFNSSGTEVERGKIDVTIDLGTDGKISNGVFDPGTDGEANVAACMDGRWGTGCMSVEANATEFILGGVFNGSYEDFDGYTTSFEGKAKAILTATDGCAKFQFTGGTPSWPVADMIPPGMAQADIQNFLTNFNLECGGCRMTADNYATIRICPNPLFDPASGTDQDPPMVLAKTDGTCESVTHVDSGCFLISNAVETGQFGSKVTQTFLKVACSKTSVGSRCADFDLDTLTADTSDLGFQRNWDCTGDFTTVDFSGVTDEALEAAFKECFAMEERLFDNEGVGGGANCFENQQFENVDDTIVKGGGKDFGSCGGEYRGTSSTCPGGGMEFMFVDPVDPANGKYCLMTQYNTCLEFTVTGTSTGAISLLVDSANQASITRIDYDSGFTTATATTSSPMGTCTNTFSINKPTFTAQDTFNPDSAGGPPQTCLDRFGTDVTEDECRSLCSQGDDPCNMK